MLTTTDPLYLNRQRAERISALYPWLWLVRLVSLPIQGKGRGWGHDDFGLINTTLIILIIK